MDVTNYGDTGPVEPEEEEYCHECGMDKPYCECDEEE